MSFFVSMRGPAEHEPTIKSGTPPEQAVQLRELSNRLTRIETRLCKLMLHVGMDINADGDSNNGGGR